MSTTAYIVLKYDPDRGDGHGAWVVLASYMAHSAKRAVDLAADDSGDGLYSAVPDRSWHPLDVTTEKRPHRVVSEPAVAVAVPD